MKYKVFVLILVFALSCQNPRTLNGNYSMCNNGEYTEVYFKEDSMRVASSSEWVKLSKWRKIIIKNDTLFFETFGEYRDSSKAKIRYIGYNSIDLLFFETDEKSHLKPINETLNFETLTVFWKEFNNRSISMNCE